MKKLVHLFLLLWSLSLFAAPVQIKDLPETTTANPSDILDLQINVSGTFRDRKMTLSNLALNLDPQLTAIASSSPAADKLWYWTSLTTGTFSDLSSYGRSLIASANAAAGRILLELPNTATSEPRARNLSAMTLKRSIAAITGVSSGISGATYNQRSGTLFLIRNVTAAPGTIYETTLDGTVLRTITNSNFIDTEAIEWVGSVVGAGTGTLYDVFLVAEEDHTLAASESSISLVLLTTGATTLDRTATNGTDPDNVTTTTAYSGGTIANLGIETVIYDSKRGVIYYTAEKQTDATLDNIAGSANAKIFTRSITATGSTLSFGAESTLCNINALFSGTLTDISDGAYDIQSDTILLLSDESHKVVRLSFTGSVIETLNTPATQPEGLAIHPDSDRIWVVGEPQEFYVYGLGNNPRAFTDVFTQTATIDFPAITGAAVADSSVTVTGAAVGDTVLLGVPNGSMTATAVFFAWVSAANTVTIRYSPKGSEDPASGVFRVTVIRQ